MRWGAGRSKAWRLEWLEVVCRTVVRPGCGPWEIAAQRAWDGPGRAPF